MRRVTAGRPPAMDREAREHFAEFTRKTVRMRVPVTGSLELTAGCNLSCVHCYLGPLRHDPAQRQREMSTGRVLGLLDEIAAAGCLNFLITGGEPLTRGDFPEVYTRAKKNGLLVTVFTNGTLLDGESATLFRELPPQAVEISLYGATAATHERITGVPGSYERCICGVELLLRTGVTVRLKTVLMSLNRHEFHAMERMADGYGVKFRVDAAIFPGFDGDTAPLALRVDPREAVEKEFSDPVRLRQWREYHSRAFGGNQGERLYGCGAGVTSFHLDSRGRLSPCLMATGIRLDLAAGSFAERWEHVVGVVGGKRTDAHFTCRSCDKKALCGYCPAFFALESGAEQGRSEYLCAMGEARFQELTARGV